MLRPYIISLRPPTTIPQVRISRPCHAGQPQRKRASLTKRAVHFDASSLELRQQTRDREAEAGSSQLTTARLIDTEETVEDPMEMLRSDPGTGTLHAHNDLLAMRYEREHHA